jgi:molecular chaperone HtpG
LSTENNTGNNKVDSNLIGQFGVGFYSSYMVADKVTVISKKAGDSQAYRWESDGQSEYTVTEHNEPFHRGTKVIVHIKEGEDVYLDHFRVKHIIKTYSDHISMPIYFCEDNTPAEIQVNSGSALWTKNKSDITEDMYQAFYKSVSYAADKPWLSTLICYLYLPIRRLIYFILTEGVV